MEKEKIDELEAAGGEKTVSVLQKIFPDGDDDNEGPLLDTEAEHYGG